jgi:uncharacterized protein YdeI (YjbR/CyaY-like superfamily)
MGDFMNDALPVMTFENGNLLRAWLEENHHKSTGIWVCIYSKHSKVPTVTFEELLDEGLCFGWSESKRVKNDRDSYLQRFTPRKTVGTQSKRNLERAQGLIEDGRMTPTGLKALGIDNRIIKAGSIQ